MHCAWAAPTYDCGLRRELKPLQMMSQSMRIGRGMWLLCGHRSWCDAFVGWRPTSCSSQGDYDAVEEGEAVAKKHNASGWLRPC